MEIKIEDKIISGENPCFIIAEAGVNHNGNFELAKKLIDAAKEAGVDAVKFQTWITEEIATQTAPKADYQKEQTGAQENQFEMIKKLELPHEDFRKLKKYAEEKEIIFLSTPDEEKSCDFLESINVVAFKVGSGEINNYPYLEHIAKKGKPMIVSTGTATLEEVKEAVNVIKKFNNQLILLHCTTNYPCPLEEVNLRAMVTLKNEFPDLLIGYSDHTMEILVPIMAAALGARVIEKHFTLDRNMEGPDHKASLNPKELAEMVKSIRETEIALGSGEKKPAKSEEEVKKVIRKNIVARNNLVAGIEIKKEDLALKRAGVGIEPKDLNKIIGKKLKRDLTEDEAIRWEDLL